MGMYLNEEELKKLYYDSDLFAACSTQRSLTTEELEELLTGDEEKLKLYFSTSDTCHSSDHSMEESQELMDQREEELKKLYYDNDLFAACPTQSNLTTEELEELLTGDEEKLKSFYSA